MTSLNKTLSGIQDWKIRIPYNLHFYFLITFCCAYFTYGGEQVLKSFNNSTDNLNISTDNGLIALDDSCTILFKVYGDTIINSGSNTNFSDVVSSGADIFQFFYVTPSTKRVLKSSVRITNSGAIFDNIPTKFADIDPFGVTYFHADKGNNRTMLSFLQDTSGGIVLTVESGTARINIDNSVFKDYIGSSQCFLENDTFLVVNSKDLNRISLRKISVLSSSISIAKEIIVEDDTEKLSNCSVGFDNDNAVLVIWSRGELDEPRKMRYKIYNRALTTSVSGILDEPVCDDSLYNYDDATIVSYGTEKFAVVFWNSSGVLMYQLSLNNGIVQQSLKPIFAKSNVRFSTAAINKNKLVIIANGDINNNGISGIEGEVFNINSSGTLVSQNKISFSDELLSPIKKIGHYSTAINCAIDSNGSIGVTWRDSNIVMGSVWANRGVKFKKGYWTSDLYSMSESAKDSIRVYPVQVFKSDWNQSNWFLEDSIRFGFNNQQTVNASWRSYSNDTILTTSPVFQFCVSINRKINRDSLLTPTIDSAAVRWNVKPRFNSIDSVKIGTGSGMSHSFGDTVSLLSRKDSARIFLSVIDPDQKDTVRVKGNGPAETALKTIVNGPLFKASVKILPVFKSDTVSLCTFSAWDKKSWYATPVDIKIKTRNSLPILRARVVLTDTAGKFDSVSLPYLNTIALQESDSIIFIYSVSDTNDPVTCKSYLISDNRSIIKVLDSTSGGVEKKYTLYAKDITPVDSLIVWIYGTDVDTNVKIGTRIIVNHAPRILYCRINGDTVFNNDTVRIALQKENIVNTSVSDTDCHFWDTLLYSFIVKGQYNSVKSNSTEIQYSYYPQRSDSTMKVTVSDKFGKVDSMRYFLKFPWLEDDTTGDSEFAAALKSISTGPSSVIGDGLSDTIQLPLFNYGNDSMSFTEIRFAGECWKWVSVSVMQNNGFATFTSKNSDAFRQVALKPDSALWCTFIFTDSLMRGDSVVHDTLIFYTSDPLHPHVVVPLCLEYNDLPRMIGLEPWFPSNIPFTGLAKQRAYRPYWFPPHASFSISFSEPVDSVSAHRGITVYSILDSIYTGTVDPIDLQYLWSQNYTKLDLRPSYKKRSPSFNVFPPEGLFIPTDSLKIRFTPDLTDRANTPHGPNNLDINTDYRRDTTGDTSLTMTVDSITFSLLSVFPSPGDTAIGTRPEITLLFNAPVYASSVDTALKDNKSLKVFSKYNDGLALPFDSVLIDSNKVRFIIGRTLFYEDSLWCRFLGGSIRDMMGFPTDNDDNGIALFLLDTTSTQDDVVWEYRVKKVRIISISPDSNENIKEVSPAIKIVFSDPLPEDVFDYSTVNNRSLQIKSKFSSDSISFKSIRMGPDYRSILFEPEEKFFSNDSIHCFFTGLSKNYRYSQEINFPVDSKNTFASHDWHFSNGNIGFYTYPNPYKPGKNELHCSRNGPCGIWFKNLHVLKFGVYEVKVVVFSMNAHPVFNSQKAGKSIRFGLKESEGRPEWLWDTRNQKGDLVASGLYFYIIYDMDGNQLIKGKLIIVR